MGHIEKAEQYYCNNFNCSQAVFTTFANEMGLDEALALKISTQFGGGARKGEMCGAVSGALMVLGLKYGHCHAQDAEEKARAYQLGEDFMNRFIAEKGTVVCRELLGYDVSSKEDMVKIRELELFKTVCPEMIRCATAIVEQMIKENEKPKPKVAFICVHNSCRSQIAEALGKKYASDVFESYSAGTEIKDHINPDAVRMMKKLHGIDMTLTQYNKLIDDIPKPDVVVLMGCNVGCPIVFGKEVENWGLEDPSGQSDKFFEKTIEKIEENILQLKKRLANV